MITAIVVGDPFTAITTISRKGVSSTWKRGEDYCIESKNVVNGTNGIIYSFSIIKTETEAAILVGQTETFEKMQRYYRRVCRTVARDPIEDDSDDEEVDGDGRVWEMETALEPEEEEAGQETREQRKLG